MRTDDASMRTREWERRVITLFVVTLIALLALQDAPPSRIALPLAVAAGLLGRIVAFYFPFPARRSAPKRKRRFVRIRRVTR